MGTNYYVTLKETDDDKFFDYSEFGSIGSNRTIKFASLHVGKSSYGWAFHYRGYRQLGLVSFDSFRDFINESNRLLVDEYGEIQDKDKFHQMILTYKSPMYINKTGDINKDHMDYCISHRSLSLETIREQMWHDNMGYSFWESNFS